jgi:hypothetical protein
MPRKKRSKEIRYGQWIASYEAVRAWMDQYDLLKLLEAGGGIVKIPNFLPPVVAEGVLHVLEHVTDWNDTSASRDYTHNNIAHSFESVKAGEAIEAVTRAVSQLLPEAFSTFSGARYQRTNFIEPHDDRAYTSVQLEDGGILECSRDIAVIYYLTKDWAAELGGALIDLQTTKRYVPEFNSVIAFRVPRMHAVEPVVGPRPRFSIFGWFLREGRIYGLGTQESVGKNELSDDKGVDKKTEKEKTQKNCKGSQEAEIGSQLSSTHHCGL